MKIAFISDIHEDVINLARAFRMIEKLKCDEIVCLGDIVGFCVPYYKYIDTRDANACIKLISENAKYVVAGNHDHFALRKLPSFTDGHEIPGNWYELPFPVRRQMFEPGIWLYEDNELSALLSESAAQYLNDLPEYITVNLGKHKFLLSHYLYPDITGFTKNFYLSDKEFRPHFEFMEKQNAGMAVFGHTHPDGLSVISKQVALSYIRKKTFLPEYINGIGVPAITSSSRLPGFAIFNTDDNKFEVYSLNSRFKVF